MSSLVTFYQKKPLGYQNICCVGWVIAYPCGLESAVEDCFTLMINPHSSPLKVQFAGLGTPMIKHYYGSTKIEEG